MRRVLSLADREEISRGLAEGLELKQIAGRLGRDPSIVSREVGRHGGRGGYRAHRAERRAAAGRRRPKTRRLDREPALRAAVLPLLRKGWSPEMVANRLPIDCPGDQAVRVSHEAIYTWLYALPVRELEAEGLALRSGRRRRKPRASAGVSRAPRISGIRWIDQRPAEAAGRRVPGHWEGDLLIGARGETACATLVERVSRFTVLVPLRRQDSPTVTRAVGAAMLGFPETLRASLTWDCGKEMARHAELTLATNMPVYFAHPHSPWERGTNENTNRWLREYFPKGTTIDSDGRYLHSVAAELNDRPRRILGWRKPSEVFADMLTATNASTG